MKHDKRTLSIHFALSIASSLAGAASVSCGAGDSRDSYPSSSDGSLRRSQTELDATMKPTTPVFVSARMAFFGGRYPDVTQVSFEVQAPGTLLLEDPDGKVSVRIAAEAYDSIVSLVELPEFVDALHDPDDCHNFPEGTAWMVVTWMDVGAISDLEAASCIGLNPNHPYRQVRDLMVDLKNEHVACPTIDPEASPITGIRQLCRVN